ncbi:hypothetical protein CANMA_003630 [Candida margitis]|uniref:uncharacterized protein n=1 Tax=Candida margitis TaxID=1775924 RepID=UPI002227187F|nr:uncharacterized protein CANMA_003630 [Candida margitis]KAI5962855.1 hypothetical protein CANMA_003630 [Candida margitis]
MTLLTELDRIDKATQSIESFGFETPGMFTNAIVNPPPIQSLLRDPTPDERRLYKVINATTTTPLSLSSNQTSLDDPKVERVDGKSMYLEHDFDDPSFISMNESENVDYEQPIVRLPTLYRPDRFSGSIEVQFKESDNLHESFEDFIAVVDKYPNLIEDYDVIRSKVEHLRQEFVHVSNEIEGMEKELANAKQALWTEFKVPTDHVVSSGELIDLDAEIQKEEIKIRQLQATLDKRV